MEMMQWLIRTGNIKFRIHIPDDKEPHQFTEVIDAQFSEILKDQTKMPGPIISAKPKKGEELLWRINLHTVKHWGIGGDDPRLRQFLEETSEVE